MLIMGKERAKNMDESGKEGGTNYIHFLGEIGKFRKKSLTVAGKDHRKDGVLKQLSRRML